jgi:hypothetical protein
MANGIRNKWYVARLLVRCQVGEDDPGPWTIDEQVHVLRAPDHETAYEKALEFGKAESHSYENAAGKNVSWDFVGLAELDELLGKVIRDGTEITYRLYDSEDPGALIPAKDDLIIFWGERNKHRTVREILEDPGHFRAKKILGLPRTGNE